MGQGLEKKNVVVVKNESFRQGNFKSPVEVGNHEFIAASFGAIVVFSLRIGV